MGYDSGDFIDYFDAIASFPELSQSGRCDEWVRVYAPPSAPFSFDIDYAGTFQVVQVTGLSPEDWEVYR